MFIIHLVAGKLMNSYLHFSKCSCAEGLTKNIVANLYVDKQEIDMSSRLRWTVVGGGSVGLLKILVKRMGLKDFESATQHRHT